MVVEVDVVEPFPDARCALVALDLALQLVGDLDLDLIDVLLGEKTGELLVNAVEEARLAG